MLRLVIPAQEVYSEETNTFANTKETVIILEHSLVSVSKWESKWCVPFLSDREKTGEEITDYIRCMTLTQNVDDSVYDLLTQANFHAIEAYINAPMTATTINDRRRRANREVITSELIYYWLVALNIPFECQKWHFNRMLMLINICSIKQEKEKPMRGRELAKSNADLNAARRAQLGTRG